MNTHIHTPTFEHGYTRTHMRARTHTHSNIYNKFKGRLLYDGTVT